MLEHIKTDQMAFIDGKLEGVGTIRGISKSALTIYVENAGEFVIAIEAVTAAHDGKVILDRSRLGKAFLNAVGHGHDREVPDVPG